MQVLDVVLLGELAVVVGRDVLLELVQRLPARLPRSTRNRTRRAPANLISR